jgi:hypothetical protein
MRPANRRFFMRNIKQQFSVTPLLLALLGTMSAVSAQESHGMQWSITPYMWASDTTVDLTFRDTNIGAGDISFNDLLDVLDAAFMVHVEGGKSSWMPPSHFGRAVLAHNSTCSAVCGTRDLMIGIDSA